MKIENLIEQFKENYKKMELLNKEYLKIDRQLKEEENDRSEVFYKLRDKIITIEEYNKIHDKKEEVINKLKAKKEENIIKTKVCFDNENIINNKIIVYIKNNILNKYNNKAIGEKTTSKIDEEIKDLLKDIFNDRYFNIYEYNTYRCYQPNQFINVFKNIDSWDYNYCNGYLYFNLKSKLNNSQGEEKQKLYINSDYQLKYDKYTKTEEIEENNKTYEEKVINTEIIEDVKAKAKEIIKTYNKKEEKIKKYKKLIEEEENNFKNIIKDNNDVFLHNIYYYYYR